MGNLVNKWIQAKQKNSNILYTTTIIRIWHWFIQILLSWKQSLHVRKHQNKHCLILQFAKQILFYPEGHLQSHLFV